MSIANEGIPYIVAPAVLALVTGALGYWPIAVVLGVFAIFMAFFFRDPRREAPAEMDVVVAPADGRVTRIEVVESGQRDWATLVSIFLSPIDVHINRAPIAGVITDVSYMPGKFLMATNEKASLVNEQNTLTIEGEKVTVICKQVAGILARRVVCWKKKGDRLSLGERFGLIKFSSRTDLLLPQRVEVRVREGARVKGGTTIIGRIR